MIAMEREQVRIAVEHLEDLPALPSVVMRLLETSSHETVDAMAIARVIESDQTLTARLLRLVNSSFYSFDEEITSVRRAVAALGLNAVRCIALGMGVARMFPAKEEPGTVFSMVDFWKHSLACAIASQLLAGHSRLAIDKEEAFTAGLLHDLGKLVLRSCEKERYESVVDEARTAGLELLEAEMRRFGAGHVEAGKWLAENWGLPYVFAQVIWLHHQPLGAVNMRGASGPLVYLVQAADAVVRMMRVGSGGNDGAEGPAAALLEELQIPPEAVRAVQEGIWNYVEEYAGALDLELSSPELYIEAVEKSNRLLSELNQRVQQKNKALEWREKCLDALNKFHLRARNGKSMREMAGVMAQCLQEGFGVERALVFAADEKTRSLFGCMWKDGDPPETVALGMNGEPAPGLSQLDAPTRAAVDDAGTGFAGNRWSGRGITEVSRFRGMVVLPLTSEGQSYGQIVMDARGSEHRWDADDGLPELLLFAQAAGAALGRIKDHDLLRRRSEELANAVWKKDQAYKQLLHSERLAAVGKMAAGAAHEVNNPLAIISGRAQMLLQSSGEPAMSKQLNLIVEQCTRASKILNDLMRFARPALPNKEVLGINGVVYEVLGMFEHRFKKHSIELETEFSQDLPKVMVDKGQIQQVLVNLFINAEHAIESPGKVTVVTRKSPDGGKVQIRVSDTGCGIPAEHLGHIFEPFYTTKEEGQGTGLGLSLAHGIITSHQGLIEADSTVGQGTTFTITLPAADDIEEAAEHADTPLPDRKPRAAHRRVLIVDDENQVRALISEALSGVGYEVLEAENGLTALEKLTKQSVDLITVDIRMPRMNGMAMIRALRERGRNVPIIVITGLASDEELEEARHLGVSACIRKPFEVTELIEQVERAVPSS